MSLFTAHIEIETGNAAFEDNPDEINRILEVVMKKISSSARLQGGPLYDINGNLVGKWHTETTGDIDD